MSDREVAETPKDYYWVHEPDPEKLIDYCKQRFANYLGRLEQTNYARRILRNWRYYYNLYYSGSGSFADTAIERLGEQGEYACLSINHYRNFIQHTLAIITQESIAYQVKAINSDQESLNQAKVGNDLLEFYNNQLHFQRYYNRALESAYILLAGYVLTEWDTYRGDTMATYIDESGVFAPRRGDLRLTNPSIFDVAYDLSLECYDDNQWFIIRQYVNKWDLIAKYPHLRDDILETCDEELKDEFAAVGLKYENTDRVMIYKFFHEDTPAVPGGREFSYIGDVPLIGASGYGASMEGMAAAQSLSYEKIRLRRLVASEYLLTTAGYSPAVDLQGIQEGYNMESSAILTNHKSCAVQNFWVQDQDSPRADLFEGGLNIIRSRTKPEGLNLTYTPEEVFKFRAELLKDGEYISGVNSVARGQPESNLRSGTALALIDAKFTQFAAPIVRNYYELMEGVGTDMLWCLNRFMNTEDERVYSIIGKYRSSMIRLKGGSLDKIDRVIVKPANPLSKTISGKVELANMFIKAGIPLNPKNLIDLVETGNIQTLLEAEESQMQIIRDENEKMLELMKNPLLTMQPGFTPNVMPTDDHMMHVKEHAALLNSTEARRNPQAAAAVIAHLQHHTQLAMDPGVQLMQAWLGYQTPMMGPAMAGGGEARIESPRSMNTNGNGKTTRNPQGGRPPYEAEIPQPRQER